MEKIGRWPGQQSAATRGYSPPATWLPPPRNDLNVRSHAWLAAATLDPAASERCGEERGGASLSSMVPRAALVTALAALWRLRKEGGWDLAQAGLTLAAPLALELDGSN